MNASEKNFCDRIKDLVEKLDERYLTPDDLNTFASSLVSALDNRYSRKGDITIPGGDDTVTPGGDDTVPPHEGDTDADTDADDDSDFTGIVRVSYANATGSVGVVDYSSANVTAPAWADSIDASPSNVRITLSAADNSKHVTMGSAGGSLKGADNFTVQCAKGGGTINVGANSVINCAEGNDIIYFAADATVNNFTDADTLFIADSVVISSAAFNGQNLVLGAQNSNITFTPVNSEAVRKVKNNSGYFTGHGSVHANTLTLFSDRTSNNVDLNSTLYSAVTKIDDSNGGTAPCTLVADSVHGGQFTLNSAGGIRTVEYYASSTHITINNTPRLYIHDGNVDGCTDFSGGYRIRVGAGSINIFNSDSQISIRSGDTGGRFKLYDLAAKDWA